MARQISQRRVDLQNTSTGDPDMDAINRDLVNRQNAFRSLGNPAVPAAQPGVGEKIVNFYKNAKHFIDAHNPFAGQRGAGPSIEEQIQQKQATNKGYRNLNKY